MSSSITKVTFCLVFSTSKCSTESVLHIFINRKITGNIAPLIKYREKVRPNVLNKKGKQVTIIRYVRDTSGSYRESGIVYLGYGGYSYSAPSEGECGGDLVGGSAHGKNVLGFVIAGPKRG